MHSTFRRCGGGSSGSGIDQVGCHSGVIAGSIFEDMAGNAIQCKGGTENIEILRCRFTNGGHRAINLGGSTGHEYFRPPLSATVPNVEARNLKVFANIFEGSQAPVAFVGCVDSIVANNTIVDPDGWILRILQESVSSDGYEFLPCGNNRFENNLIFFNRAALSTYVNIGPDTAQDSFIFANNLWFAHDNPAHSAPYLPALETGGIYSHDPDFFDTAKGDYRIDSHSPAAAGGLSPSRIAGDYNGNCYCQPPSIGAYAYVGCPGDADFDGDVDGLDLAILSGSPEVTHLNDLVENYGTKTCETRH